MWEYLSTELPLCCTQCKYNSWRKLPLRASSAFFYPSSSSSIVFSVLWWWYSVRETRQIKCSVILWQDHIPSLWSCCCLDCFSLAHRVLFHWSTSIRVSGRFGRLQCLIICSLWNEPRDPVSAEKPPWLTFHTIRAFPNAQRSDSLRSSSGTNYTMLLTAFWPPLQHLQSTPLFIVVNNYSYTSTAASHLSFSLTVFLCWLRLRVEDVVLTSISFICLYQIFGMF